MIKKFLTLCVVGLLTYNMPSMPVKAVSNTKNTVTMSNSDNTKTVGLISKCSLSIVDSNKAIKLLGKTESNTVMKSIGIYNNAISNGSEAAWYSLSHTNSSQQWYLEPVNFARGDVNMDGEITLSDSSYIMNMYSDISTGNNHFSNIQIFLADYNGDGKVDA